MINNAYECRLVLQHIREVGPDDIIPKFDVAVKMLFALITSVQECASVSDQRKIFGMYESLISIDGEKEDGDETD